MSEGSLNCLTATGVVAYDQLKREHPTQQFGVETLKRVMVVTGRGMRECFDALCLYDDESTAIAYLNSPTRDTTGKTG